VQVRNKFFMKNIDISNKMKTRNFLLGMALACVVGSAFVGCGGSSGSNTRSARAGETVLNLNDKTCVNWQVDTVPAESICQTGGFWSLTYDSIGKTRLCFGDFVFDHESGFDMYSYWGGFTFGTNGDTLCYSKECQGHTDAYVDCDSLGSGGWILNQWGVMAGGGIKTYDASTHIVTEVEKGLPYLINFGGGDIWMKDSAYFAPIGLFICTHPWPFWGNLYGDGFARPLNLPGDYFVLTISGLDATGGLIDVVIDTLAHNVGDTLHQSNQWHWVDLSDIGGGVQFLRFDYESSDNDPDWGPNTAMYVCMDKLTVIEGASKKIAAQKSGVKKSKTPLIRKREFDDYLTFETYNGGDAVIHGADGKAVLKTTFKAGNNKIDTKKLPSGEYLLRHNGRNFNLVKK
jgi:hypothetical protein